MGFHIGWRVVGFWADVNKFTMLNFDADVKKTTARHQCENPFNPLFDYPLSGIVSARGVIASTSGPLKLNWNLSARRRQRLVHDDVSLSETSAAKLRENLRGSEGSETGSFRSLLLK